MTTGGRETGTIVPSGGATDPHRETGDRPPILGAGRMPAAQGLRSWVGDPAAPPLCVLTGSAGAGKSHLLAWLAIAEQHTVNAVLSARGMTAEMVAWAIADQLALPGRPAPELLARIAADARPATILIGELDTSGVGCDGSAAHDIVTTLVNPLAATGHVRLLVEGRPESVASVGAADGTVSDASGGHADPVDHAPAASAVPAAPAEPGAPAAPADPAIPLRTVNLDDPRWTDPDEFASWLGGPPAEYPNPGLAMLARTAGPGPDVVVRWLARQPVPARPALSALAFAFEPVDVPTWQTLCAAVSPDPRQAASAVRAATAVLAPGPDGRYLLPCRPVQDAIARSWPDPTQAHRAITAALTATLRTLPSGQPDWSAASPYVLRHLLRHATVAGTARPLLGSTEDLLLHVHADPRALTAAYSRLPELPPLGRVWRRVAPILLRSTDAAPGAPDDRAALLHLAALLCRHGAAVPPLAALAEPGRWRTQWTFTRSWRDWSGPPTALAYGTGARAGQLLVGTALGRLSALSEPDATTVERLATQDEPPAQIAGLAPLDGDAVVVLDGYGGLHLSASATEPSENRTELLDTLLNATPTTSTSPATVLRALRQHPRAPLTALASDPSMLVAGDSDGTVHTWRLTTPPVSKDSAPEPEAGGVLPGPPTATELHAVPVTAIACLRTTDDVPLVIAGGADGTVRLWSPGAAPFPDPVTSRQMPVSALAAAQLTRGPAFAVAWTNGIVEIWDLDQGMSAEFRLPDPVTALALHPTGHLAAAHADSTTLLALHDNHLWPT